MTEETLVTMTWLIPALPLLVFFLVVLFTNRNKTLSWILAWAGVLAALILGWAVALQTAWAFIQDPHHFAEHPIYIADSFKWLPAGFLPTWLEIGIAVDALASLFTALAITAGVKDQEPILNLENLTMMASNLFSRVSSPS